MLETGGDAKPLRLHVLCEYGADFRPHGSAFLRLIRPLTHPASGDGIEAAFDSGYDGQPVDAVIVDRLWRPDVTLARAEQLVDAVRSAGAQLIYTLDDNLLDLAGERGDWPTAEHIQIIETWLRAARGVIVTSAALAERLLEHNPRVVVLPNALDERLLVATAPRNPASAFGRRPIVIGYMGTRTHDADLEMIEPALRTVCERHPGQLELAIVGVVGRDETAAALHGLPVRRVHEMGPEHEYGHFMLWFTGTVQWDIAVAPLRDSVFTRCKSDVKFLDYAAISAPGVFSRAPAYASTVRHLETGLLADDDEASWVEALELLIGSPDLRWELACGAARYLHRERTLAHCAPRWPETIRSLLTE